VLDPFQVPRSILAAIRRLDRDSTPQINLNSADTLFKSHYSSKAEANKAWTTRRSVHSDK
jgi:hypothetical protein